MKKNLFAILVALTLAILSLSTALADTVTIGVPNDGSNEYRALKILEDLGVIKLKEDIGFEATIADIAEYALDVQISEIEAAQIPYHLESLDYAVINSNYALGYNLNPVEDALAIENTTDNPYANILAVKAGNEDADATKALIAALKSQQVVDFLAAEYPGSVLSVVAEPTDGYDETVDYEALAAAGAITVAASPTPHAVILAVVKDILAAKGVTLTVTEFDDYVLPNQVVDNGEIFANYFQHLPYLESFNANNGTEVVSVADVHLEPMGLYGGKQTTLDALTVAAE